MNQTDRQEALLKHLRSTFKVEAQEHIGTVSRALLQLEKDQESSNRFEVLDTAFRAVHSLKGASSAVNYPEISSICHAVENIFSGLRNQSLSLSTELFNLLHKTIRQLALILELPEYIASPPAEQLRVSDLLKLLQGLLGAQTVTSKEKSLPKKETPSQPQLERTKETQDSEKNDTSTAKTIRVSVDKLNAVLLQAEEMLLVKQTNQQNAIQLRESYRIASEWGVRLVSLRPDLRFLQQFLETTYDPNKQDLLEHHLSRIVDFLEWGPNFLEEMETLLLDLSHKAEHNYRVAAAMIDNLQREAIEITIQSASTLLDIFPALVRQLALEQGKNIEVSLKGGSVEIDQRILEYLKTPLIHLIRNCVDHGIELPEARQAKGKSATGRISIHLSVRSGSHIELVISDDGAGINLQKIKSSAEKVVNSFAQQTENLTVEELTSLIYQPGVSTNSIITDISGRGLGLAIVKDVVEKLNGTINVQTEDGKGTSFLLQLPLTVDRLRGLVIQLGAQNYVIPVNHIARIFQIDIRDIETIQNRSSISINQQIFPLVQLKEVLGMPHQNINTSEQTAIAVLLSSATHKIAFTVDRILDEQEVLAKSLGPQLVRIRNISGATLLQDGSLSPILNVPELIDSALKVNQSNHFRSAFVKDEPQTVKKSILIAEDSITSRILMKSILESSGYAVETSVDGLDALTKLRSQHFDLIVSDVDMPRMNGFGLTAKIRADKKFTHLPVVLVTALDSREDREHGINVGANAYIVKGNFDQTNLIEIIRRLL